MLKGEYILIMMMIIMIQNIKFMTNIYNKIKVMNSL